MNIIFEKKLKKVYISGPMTGIPDYNRSEFKKAEDKFTQMNFEVINPHNLFTKEELDEIFSKVKSKEITEEDAWGIFMKRDIEHLMKCDFVAILPYWETSRGANLELANAKAVKMPIINADTLQEMTTNINFSINKYQKL